MARAGSAPEARRTVALALGGGGARSIAQIAVIEALDEMGVRPAAIAGTSMGALVGAACAAGMTGRAMRRHVIGLAHSRGETLAKLLGARIGKWSDLLGRLGNPVLIDGEKLCAAFLPPQVPERFEQLETPLIVSATDLHARGEATFATGLLRPALAASMAVPGVFRPVEIGGRVCVDGAAVNPLPFDHLRGRADIIVAVDSLAGPLDAGGVPDPLECLLATITVIGHNIVAAKLLQGAPDITVRPRMDAFRVLDFFRASAILRAAEPAKAELKEKLAPLLSP